MTSVRRWYIFLVCAVSLQSAAWGVIGLARDWLTGRRGAEAIALPIAVVVIGLPLFAGHWLWAGYLARRDPEERRSHLRSIYLYAMLGGFLAPFLASAYDLVNVLILRLLGVGGLDYAYGAYSYRETLLRSLAAMAVLAVLWAAHLAQIRADGQASQGKFMFAVDRRLYLLVFSGAGLTLAALGMIKCLGYFLFRVFALPVTFQLDPSLLATALTRLAVGLPVWLLFWWAAQQSFASPSAEEKESALRKFYLYAAVFAGVLCTVANATVILAAFIRHYLELVPYVVDIRQPLAVVVVMAAVWAYHAAVLRADTRQEEQAEPPAAGAERQAAGAERQAVGAERQAVGAERQAVGAERQAGIHRLYLYIVAAVGLGAALIGLGGVISVLIRASAGGSSFNEALRIQLAWFAAALIAGLPVWFIPWRAAQRQAGQQGPAGAEARRSIVRKIYLYFFLFAAAMTALAGAVYIVQRLVSAALGDKQLTLSDLGQAIAFTLIAVCVWAGHAALLRGDGQWMRRLQATRLADLRVVLVDTVEEHFGEGFTRALQRELPDLDVNTLIAQEPEDSEAEQLIKDLLDQAGLIIAPWTAAVPGLSAGPLFAAALEASKARRLLLPFNRPGWDWAGIDELDPADLVRQAAAAARQIAAGQEVKPQRALGAGTVIAIVIGVMLIALIALALAANFFRFRD